MRRTNGPNGGGVTTTVTASSRPPQPNPLNPLNPVKLAGFFISTPKNRAPTRPSPRPAKSPTDRPKNAQDASDDDPATVTRPDSPAPQIASAGKGFHDRQVTTPQPRDRRGQGDNAMYDPEDYEGDRDLDAHPELEPEMDGDIDDGEPEPREDQFRDDVEADADVLASAGYGTDEDYGSYDGGFYDDFGGFLDSDD